ncbi:MAG: glycosyltransferase [Candidatus Aenigmarchaeota archaeon]|nr:glycosyltransferase [Candidatus Aenigmarchaeota archaeon]
MPRISVIIPTLNEEHYIRRALDSLRKQTFKDFEIVVVDSHSTDATIRTAKRCGARIVFAAKRGPWHAKNMGAKKARGTLLLFLDADTKVPRDYLSVINDGLKNPRVALLGPEVRMDAPLRYRAMLKLVYAAFILLGCINRAPAVMAAACRKSDFLKTGGFPAHRLGEDVEFSRKMSRLGKVLIRNYCVTSQRRFEHEGFLRLCAIYTFSLVEFLLTGKMSHKGYEFGVFEKPWPIVRESLH